MGCVEKPGCYRGVSLIEKIKKNPDFDQENGLNLIAKTGYKITLSDDQLINCKIAQYDADTGEQLITPIPFITILAYEVEGEKLDVEKAGKLRVMMVSEEPNQMANNPLSEEYLPLSWWIKNLTHIFVK